MPLLKHEQRKNNFEPDLTQDSLFIAYYIAYFPLIKSKKYNWAAKWLCSSPTIPFLSILLAFFMEKLKKLQHIHLRWLGSRSRSWSCGIWKFICWSRPSIPAPEILLSWDNSRLGIPDFLTAKCCYPKRHFCNTWTHLLATMWPWLWMFHFSTNIRCNLFPLVSWALRWWMQGTKEGAVGV